MALDKKAALEQIDAALKQYDEYGNTRYYEGFLLPRNNAKVRHTKEVCTRMSATLIRLAPPNSFYSNVPADDPDKLAGNLKALRSDMEAGYLESVTELVHGETFSDFLDMASHLLSESYKDAAAVIAGGVLEQHLRTLCTKHGITPIPENLNNLNSALYKKAYQSDWMKQVTAWADIRNNAAHGHYAKVDAKQVDLMLQGIRFFVSAHPA